MARTAPRSRTTVEQLEKLEEQIELLKVAYERYFNGVDRVPPAKEHEALKRAVFELMRGQLPSSVLRFRFSNLRARVISYEQYWTRILLQIEKGTFRRVVAESERRQTIARRQAALDRANAAAGGAGAAEQPTQPAAADERRRTGPPPLPKAPAALPEGMDAKTARELFRDFVTAKKAAGERTEGITYGGLVQKLAAELPKLREKHGAEVRFEVATVDGKVRLRARTRRE